MSIVKRFNRLLGLEKIDVLVDEKDKSRHIIISDMPESLPQGKSSFLIEVSPYMRKGIELQIDFIDAKGNSIYVEPVSNYLEGTSRTVSVEVYNTVAPGVATMIIVGELEGLPLTAGNFSETEEIPDEFKGVYNVRLTKEVIINTAEINTQPIKFYSSPRLTAVEKRFGTMEREVVSAETTSSAFSIIGTPIQQEPFSIYTPSESEIDALGAGVTEIDEVPQPPDGNIKGDKADIERLKRSSKKRSVRGDTRFKRSKRIRRRRSPEEYPYRFTINDSNHEFTTEEIGGEIKFSNIVNIYDSQQLEQAGLDSLVSFNVVTDINDDNFPTHYTASIAKLENNKTAFVNTPFTKQDKNGNYRLLPMEATAKVHYTKEPTASYSVTNIVSYADVTLSHLRTFSGEVFKAKVYVRAEGSRDDYKLLAEVPVESPELMIDTTSVGIGERTGVITSDLDLNTNWEKFGGTNGLSTATSTTTASYDNSGSLDSVMISGSISSFTDQIRFQQKDAYKFNLTKGIDYDLSFNAVGEKGTDGRALLMIYVSGSALKQKDNLHFDEKESLEIIEPSQYGRRMGVLEVEAGDDVRKEFGLIRHNFNPNLTGDAKVQFRIISGKWNLSDISVVPSTDTGFSPSFVNFQQELPPELTHKRPEKLEFLTEFYDINNNLADEIAVTTGSTFTGGNMVITGDDNVLSHNLFIGGDTTGSGIHMGGTSSTLPDDNYSDGATGSGFIRSIGYLGFESASNAALGGKKGFMIYSGSVLPNSGENYSGVGLELVGASGSLKFRTNPSVFDVQADAFFVGRTTSQFISGSGEQIEISSSNFHVTPEGNVTMSGTITAEAGNIGGFEIEDGRLTSGTGNSSVTMSGASQLFRFGSGSQFDTTAVDGILFGKDTDGKYKFAVGKGTSYILFDGTNVNIRSEDINVTASVFSIDVDVFKLSSNNLFISSSQGGFISAGNPRPSGIGGTNKGFFVQGNDPSDGQTKFLIGAATASHISFDGSNIFMSSSAFFLGGPSQFVSGSGGNIEVSSSNFHLDRNGNVKMTGTVTATAGNLGGFSIGGGAISSNNFFISGSATGNQFFISSSNFNIKASGDVTASALDLTGGSVGGIAVSEGEVSVGSILKLKDSGQITGSSVLFTGGKIGGFTIDADEIKSTNVLIDSANEKITLGSANAVKLQGGGTDNFIAMGSKSTFSNEGTGTAGIIIGMDGTNPQAEFVKDASNYFIFDDGIDIKTDTLTASGSSIVLESPRFFLGKTTTNFISGSNGNIEISSSQFHLTKEGNVTGSAILLGNKGTGQFLQFVNNTLTVQGAITADSIAVPSAAPTPSSSISSGGLLKTVSASIGGFDITSTEIKDSDSNLRLKSSGQITGSKVLFNGGTIGGFTIDADEIKSGTNIALDSANKRLTINSATFGNAGIQLEYNSGTPRFYVGDGSNEFVKYDGSSVDIRTKKLNASGSNITLETPTFFLGRKSNQFVSGSNGNVEISSSNFHLTADGNVTMSGEITAAGGTIGGFTIGDELTSTAGTLILRGAAGVITASNAKITGDITANTITANSAGTIANFNISSTEIASSNNKLRLKSNGQITASAVSMSGTVTATAGNIAGFQISGTKLQQGTSFNLDGNASADFFISSSDFQVTPSGDVSGSKVLFTGGTIGGWTITSNRFNSSDENFRISSTGAITIKNHSFGQSGFQVIENGGTTQFYVGNGLTKFIKFDGSNVDIGTERLTASGSSINLGAPSFRLGSATNFISGSGGTLVIQNSGTTTLSGSAVTIETPRFFFGQNDNQFVSGSNGNIEISSSKFHVKPDGDVIMNNITASNANVSGKMTATSGEIGGFTIGDDLSNSAGSTLKLKGSSGQITASAAQITGDITANTITANTAGTIANFQINSTEIKSANQNLRLKANGQITASAAQITGKVTANSGQIAGFTIDGNTLTATNFTLDASGKSISLGNPATTDILIADADTGIQLGHATFASAPFSVTKGGVLKATSGTVGGWTLGSDRITGGSMIIRSDGTIESEGFASDVRGSGFRLTAASGGFLEVENARIRGTLSTAVFEKESVNAVGGQLYVANSTVLSGSSDGLVAASDTTMSVANVGGFVANEILSAKKVNATGFATEYMLVQSASRNNPASDTDFSGKLFVTRGYGSGISGDSGSLGDTPSAAQTYTGSQVIVSTGKVGTGYIRLNANPNDTTTPYMDIVERTGSGVYDVSLKARLGDLSGLSSGLLYGNSSPGFGLFTENVFLQGAITATTGSFTGKVHVGTTDGIVIDGNAKKLYQGAGTHNNDDTGFYMDSTGKFSLGDKLVWNSSTETLSITGTVNITAGSGFATAASVSGSFPSATSVSASLNASSSALTTNLNASSSALQGDINQVSTSVSASLNASSSALQGNINTVQSNLNTVSSSTAANIMTNANGKIVKTPSTSGLSGLILKSTHLGFASSGTFKAFIGSTGNFLFKNDDDNLISFGQTTSVGDGTTTSNLVIKAANAYLSGSSINLLTSRFFFGDSSNFISGSGGNLKIFSTGETTLSGSSVTIETPKFFLGKQGSQFVSGSNNLIEISSSKFHLKNDGNVIMNQITASDAKVSGDITADTITANTAGTIGGFSINSAGISSTSNNLVLSSSGEITASNYLFNGNGIITGSVTIGTSATILGSLSAGSIATPSSGPPFKSEINSEGYARFVSASIGGFRVDETTISDFTNANLQISSSGVISGSKVLFDGGKVGGWTINANQLSANNIKINAAVGYIEAGDLSNVNDIGDSSVGFFANKDGEVLIKAGTSANKNYMQFKSGTLDINTDKATISGSSIILKTNDFFLGKTGAQFISGSNNNIEITSSMFHLDPANNKVAISGSITATTGKIGGMLLESSKLKSQYGDGSVITKIVTVSSGVYYIDGVQQPTLELKVGNTYRFDNSHSSNSGHPFRFATSADGTIYSTNVTVVGSEGNSGTAYVQIVVTASTPSTLYYKCTSHSNMGGQLNIITIGTLELNGVNGQITGSDVLISGGKISGSNLEINVPNVTMSGSSVDIRTSQFFLGSNSQFISGSNNNIEISSSAFHLNPANNTMVLSGSITATDGNIGGFTIDSDEIKSTALAGETVNYTVTNNGSSYYLIDGVNQPALTFVVGNTYVFTMDSSVMSNHPFRIGTSSNGGVISDGVTVTSTSLTIVVSASTPTSLYYFCTSHSGMGNSITVNAGIPKLLLNGELGQITASAAKITGDITANTITANTAGTIGGFTLNSVGLISSDGNLVLSGSGQITASAVSMSGTIVASSGNVGGFIIDSSEVRSSNNNLRLKSNGQITASAISMSGTVVTDDIDATGGTIGGLTVGSTSVRVGTDLILKSTGQITASAAKISGDITITGGSLAGVTTDTISGSIDAVSSSLAGRQTPFETQVVLSSGGMSLNKNDGTSLANYGDTTRIGQSGEARVEISNTTLEMYDGAGTPSKRVELDSSGNLTLGKSGEARTVITDSDISLYSGQSTSRKRVAIDNSGKIAIGGASGADVSVSSTDDVIRLSPGSGVTIFKDSNNKAVVDSSGLTVTAGNKTVGTFGSTVSVGQNQEGQSRIVISGSSMNVFTRQSGTATSRAEFGETVRIGAVAAEHISASSAGITLKDGSNQLGVFNAGGLTVGKTTGAHISMSLKDVSMFAFDDDNGTVEKRFQIVPDSAGVATVCIGGSTGETDLATSTSNIVRIDNDSGIKIFRDSDKFAHMNQNGFRVYRGDASNPVATFGATAHVGRTDGTNNNVFIDSDSVDIRRGTQISASFGITDTTIGSTIGNHVKINGTALEIKTDANTTALSASAAGLEMKGKIRATSGDIGGFSITETAISSSNNNLILRSNGQITASAMSMSGAVVATSGEIGGFRIGTDLDSTSGTLTLKGASGQITASAVSMSGTITAEAGQIGGFSIANNRLTGSGTALIATNTGTDRIEVRSADNTLVFLEGTKNISAPIFFLGKTVGDPSGEVSTTNVNRYGPRASGSTGTITNQNNLGQFRVQNPDIMAGNGMSSINLPGRFYYQYSNVWSTLNMGTSAGSISGIKGRSSIWGETRQTAGSSNQTTEGLLVGVGGAHHDGDLSNRWNLSTGLLGVSSPHYANFTSANLPTGSGVPLTSTYSDGSYGLISLGDVYSTGSFVLRDGPLVVSASTDGEFGGGESGVIIDSSNVGNQEAALTFKNDAQSYIMGVDGDDVFRLNRATSLSGDNNSTGLAITSTNFTYINGTIILLNGGYASTGVNITAGGVILSADYGVFDGGIRTGGGSADPGDGNILFTGDISGSSTSTGSFAELEVEDNLNVTGDIGRGMKQTFPFGYASTFSNSVYMRTINGVNLSGTRGYVMHKPGKILAVTFACDVTSVTTAINPGGQAEYSSIKISVTVNGSLKLATSNISALNASTDLKTAKSQTIAQAISNGHTFSANDVIAAYATVTHASGGGYISSPSSATFDEVTIFCEVVFDE